jgi:hypothetical protein
MLKTVYIDYRISNTLTNAYSVKLASVDSSYGIKETDTSTVVVPNNTTVSNPSIGRYEYTFDVTAGLVYTVSWKVVPYATSQDTFITQQIGPFSSSDTIRAVADYKGFFIQGTTATMMLKITDFDGNAVDAEEIEAKIRDNSGNLIDTFTPEHVVQGFYVFDWEIPLTQTAGEYIVTWSYTIEGVTRVELQEIIVAVDATDTSIYSGNPLYLRFALESYLRCPQSIPVYFEQAKSSVDNKTFRFTFPRWNQTTGVKIFRNKKLITDNLEVNFFKGEVVFDNPQTDYDLINADYNFKWYSDSDLNQFIVNAINTFNSFPPHSQYNYNSIPTRFIPGVLQKAATDALRQIMLCLQFQEPQQVFGGADAAGKAFSNMETLKKNYEDEWKLVFENKKYGPFVGLTRAVVVPEFTLPGGRSRWFRYLFSGGSG